MLLKKGNPPARAGGAEHRTGLLSSNSLLEKAGNHFYGRGFNRKPVCAINSFRLWGIIFRLIIYRQHHRSAVCKAPLCPRDTISVGKPVPIAVTSFPAPGRKLLTVMVRPGAGKGASITLRMNGCTRAGEISRLFSTSSKICKKTHRTLVQCLLVSPRREPTATREGSARSPLPLRSL